MISSDLALILHARPYRESSQLVSLFCRHHGRFTLVARAARASGRKGNPLQPFCLLQIGWSGRGELKTLRSAEIRQSRVLQGANLYIGLYLNEVLMRLIHEHEAHEEVFDLYEVMLRKLAQGGDVEPSLRMFEFQLLAALGYGFALNCDGVSGQAVEAEHYYGYDAERGLYLLAQPQTDRASFQGGHLLAIADGDFTAAEVRLTAKRLSRLALARHLGDKPLVSRELFRGAVFQGGGVERL
jgi:DNA repair protein RecO (recombination protein O)